MIEDATARPIKRHWGKRRDTSGFSEAMCEILRRYDADGNYARAGAPFGVDGLFVFKLARLATWERVALPPHFAPIFGEARKR